MLRKFGYDDEIKLRDELLLSPPFTVFHVGFCKSVLLLVIVSILSTFKINMFSL
jgi:hypothetical protein